MKSGGSTSQVLRWLGVLPAALLSGAVGYFVWRFLTRLLWGGGGTMDFLGDLVAHGIAGLLFVAAGVAVAPKAKRSTSIVLAVMVAVVAFGGTMIAQGTDLFASQVSLGGAIATGAVAAVAMQWSKGD